MADTNNEIFQIDRFQMKICDLWGDDQKIYEPYKGEPIYITASIDDSVPTPIFVIGDGSHKLAWLVSAGYYYINNRTLDSKIPNITVGTPEPSGGVNGDIYIQVEGNA